jgi:hypothetical protein
LFAWNIVLNTPVKRLVADLRKASAVAVDSSRGYFFVVEQVQSLQEGELKPLESSVVNRYGFVL